MSVLNTFHDELLEAIVAEPPEFPGKHISTTQVAATSVLDTFPVELIDAIVSSSPESLESLSLVGRPFIESTQRRLFYEVDICNEKQCKNLGAVLLTKPHLAQYVKRFRVSMDTKTRDTSWAVSSIELPVIMLRLTTIKTFSVWVDPQGRRVDWDELGPSLKNAVEETMSRPTLISVALVNFTFPSHSVFARLLCRAHASLEKIVLVAAPIAPMIPIDPDPEVTTDPLSMIAPNEVTIYNDIWATLMRILLPAPANPFCFINTSNIHSLNLGIVHLWETSTVRLIVNDLPSLRKLSILFFTLPLYISPPMDFRGCTQLTSLCLNFCKSLDPLAGRWHPKPAISSSCPIAWAIKTLSTFPDNSIQTIKLGVSPDLIAPFNNWDRVPSPENFDELDHYMENCPYPPLIILSILLSRAFGALRSFGLCIGQGGDESGYRSALDIARDYLVLGWRIGELGGELSPVTEGVVTVKATIDDLEAYVP